MEEIGIPVTILYHLTHKEMSRFNRSVIMNSEASVNSITRLQLLYGSYHGALDSFDRSLRKPSSEPETEPLSLLDTDRKGVFFIIDKVVRNSASHSPIAEVKAAAKALLPILNNYADTPRVEYEGETGAIDKLIEEFEKPENAAHIMRLGQTENVEALKQINIKFQALYEIRYKHRHSFKLEGTTRQRRKAVITELCKFCRAVNGLALTASDPAEISALQIITASVNAAFDQYTTIVHRRIGVAAAKRKEKEKNKEKGKEDGKDSGKENENTQKPDITNPPPTDATPQKPGNNTPPTINPDDLNPPAVGEH